MNLDTQTSTIGFNWVNELESILEEHGYRSLGQTDSLALDFYIPNHLGTANAAQGLYDSNSGTLTIGVGLLEGRINPLLLPGVWKMVNLLNCEVAGIKFAFSEEEFFVSLDMSMSCIVNDEFDIERQVPYMLDTLRDCLAVILPVLQHYLTQRVRVRYRQDGRITEASETFTVEECLAMIPGQSWGRA